MKITGIYKIENLINHKCYIGQSCDVHKRWLAHKNDAGNVNCKHYNYPLYRAFRKYGIENFSFEILEECSIENLNELEKKYIATFNSVNNGYNQCDGGDSVPHYTKLSNEKVLEIVKLLKTTNLSFNEIAKKFNVHNRTIRDINRGVYSIQTNLIYPIRVIDHHKTTKHYKKKSVRKGFCKNCGISIWKKNGLCRKCADLKQRRCEWPSKEQLEHLIKQHPMTTIGKMFNVSDNAVRKWCKTYGIDWRK